MSGLVVDGKSERNLKLFKEQSQIRTKNVWDFCASVGNELY